MTQLKHTPGPWKVVHIDNIESECCVEADDCSLICEVYTNKDFYTGNMQQSNARLIAAAPEMLKALIEFCEVNCTECNIVCGTHCALYDSKTIIERATGLKIEEVIS